MNDEKFLTGLGVIILALIIAISIGTYISGERQFKLDQLKLMRPLNDHDEIMRRLERIERTLETK